MAAPACPYCGRPVVAGAAFCSACGRAIGPPPGAPAPIPVPPPAVAPPGAPPGSTPYAWPSGPPLPSPYAGNPYAVWAPVEPTPTLATDSPALGDAMIGGVLLIIGVLAGLVGNAAITGTAQVVAVSSGNVALSQTVIDEAAALTAVTIVIYAVAIAFFARAFRGLAPSDQRFRTPGTLSLLAIVGLILIAPVLAALLLSLSGTLSCFTSAAASQNNTSAVFNGCSGLGAILGLALLTLILGIIALVGWIGTGIGIYRLGVRNRDTVMEIGGVLFCLPYLNVIGGILIIIGAYLARGRLRSGTPVPVRYA